MAWHGRVEESTDDIGKDETIRRLKLLSISQTAFLKVSDVIFFVIVEFIVAKSLTCCYLQDYIGKRLKKAKDLVNSALIVLKNEGASSELIDSLAELDIDSLTSVDVKSVQLMMHEELAMLRSALEGGDVKVPVAVASTSNGNSEDSAASKEAISKLEAENANLRGLLKELKEELVISSKSQSDGNANDAKISALNDQMSAMKVDSESQQSKLKEIQAELEASQAAHAALNEEHEALKSTQEGTAGETSATY